MTGRLRRRKCSPAGGLISISLPIFCLAFLFFGTGARPFVPALAAKYGNPRRCSPPFSPLFCEIRRRFDENEIPRRDVPAHGAFALFLLVRNISILGRVIAGSPELFSPSVFDEIFIFNEENLTGPGFTGDIAVRYVDVSWLWSSYPRGFDAEGTPSNWIIRKRKWGYHHMIRFFWRSVFLLPEIKNVSHYMRIDGDSCISHLRPRPRSAFDKGVVYLSNRRLSDPPRLCKNLEMIVRAYVAYFGITVQNPRAWRTGFRKGAGSGYYNNLELLDVRFWMRFEVQHFVHFIDCAWGIYLHRWGDAVLRFVALSLFAREEMVRQRPVSWSYVHPCRVN
jgi:hypothetical protein